MAKTNSGLLEFKDAQKVLIALDDATSEVKKAVIIDADGTETDIAGGGGGVTVEALSVTENGTYSEEGKAYSPVTVNVAGGSSDFSTAEVKAIQNVLGVNFKTIAYIDGGEMLAGYDEADEFFMRSFNWVSVNDPLNVVMYNGHANLILARNGETQIVATENPDNVVITYDDETGMYNLALTGDCTITIS